MSDYAPIIFKIFVTLILVLIVMDIIFEKLFLFRLVQACLACFVLFGIALMWML